MVPDGLEGEAIQRLAGFENAYERLTLRLEEIRDRLEGLKGQGKQKTAQFRELFGEKLLHQNMLLLWESYGIR